MTSTNPSPQKLLQAIQRGPNVADIPYAEIHDVGPPSPSVGNIGDIYIDLQPDNLSLYGKLEAGWTKWAGPETQYLPYVHHPRLHKHVLWCKPDLGVIGWRSRSIKVHDTGKNTSTTIMIEKALYNRSQKKSKRKRPQNADDNSRATWKRRNTSDGNDVSEPVPVVLTAPGHSFKTMSRLAQTNSYYRALLSSTITTTLNNASNQVYSPSSLVTTNGMNSSGSSSQVYAAETSGNPLSETARVLEYTDEVLNIRNETTATPAQLTSYSRTLPTEHNTLAGYHMAIDTSSNTVPETEVHLRVPSPYARTPFQDHMSGTHSIPISETAPTTETLAYSLFTMPNSRISTPRQTSSTVFEDDMSWVVPENGASFSVPLDNQISPGPSQVNVAYTSPTVSERWCSNNENETQEDIIQQNTMLTAEQIEELVLRRVEAERQVEMLAGLCVEAFNLSKAPLNNYSKLITRITQINDQNARFSQLAKELKDETMKRMKLEEALESALQEIRCLSEELNRLKEPVMDDGITTSNNAVEIKDYIDTNNKRLQIALDNAHSTWISKELCNTTRSSLSPSGDDGTVNLRGAADSIDLASVYSISLPQELQDTARLDAEDMSDGLSYVSEELEGSHHYTSYLECDDWPLSCERSSYPCKRADGSLLNDIDGASIETEQGLTEGD